MNMKSIDTLKFNLFILIIVFIILFILKISLAQTNIISVNKSNTIWICFVTSVKSQECGTYNWSNKKELAIKTAKELCEKHCETKCVLDYCEKRSLK